MRMRTENAIDSASPKSMRKVGIGMKRTARIAMMPPAKPTSRSERGSTAGAISMILASAIAERICPGWLARGWRDDRRPGKPAPDAARVRRLTNQLQGNWDGGLAADDLPRISLHLHPYPAMRRIEHRGVDRGRGPMVHRAG